MSFYGNLSGATGRSSGSEDAKDIKYTDTMSIGGTNVQAVLDIIADKVLNRLLTKEEATQIVDALNSTSTTAALSANQGRELYQMHRDNYSLITGNQTKLSAVEGNINSLQNLTSAHTADILANSNNISALQSSVSSIESSIPSGQIATMDTNTCVSNVSNSGFQIISGGIRIMPHSTLSVVIGVAFRPIGTVSLTTTAVTIGSISDLGSINGLSMNSENFGITGTSSLGVVNGDVSGNGINISIKASSGTISVPNYEPIALPPLFIFH